MESVKVSSKGQIVIPKGLREAQHIATGTELFIFVVGDELRLKPAPTFPSVKVKNVAGVLAKKGRKGRNDADNLEAIGKMLKEQDEATKK